MPPSPNIHVLAQKKRKWTANKTAELSRLAGKETDWKLPGNQGNIAGLSRTLGKKIVLSPLLTSPITTKILFSLSDDDSDKEEEEVDSDADDDGCNLRGRVYRSGHCGDSG